MHYAALQTHHQFQQRVTQLQLLVKHVQELLPPDGCSPASQLQVVAQLPPELLIAAQQLLHSCPSAAAWPPPAGSSQRSVSGSAQPIPASQSSRQQRHAAALAPSFRLKQNAAAAAAALALGLQQVPAGLEWGRGSGGSAHLAACRVSGCRICAFEQRSKKERQTHQEPASAIMLPTISVTKSF